MSNQKGTNICLSSITYGQTTLLMLPKYLTLPLALALLSLLVQCTSSVERKAVDLPISDFQAGDVVFRRGESMASRVVLFNDPDGEYSHVGMIVQSDSGLLVVHALPGTHPTQAGEDLVRAERLSEFFAPENALYGKVMRLPLNSTQKGELSYRALQKVEEQTEFDHDYDFQDTTKLYCTEFLQLLYAHVGIDLAEGRTTRINIPGLHADLIMPADVHRNKRLKTVFSF